MKNRHNYRPRNRRWSFSMCCNRTSNGSFKGSFDAVQIGLGRGNFEYGTDYLDDFDLMLVGPRINVRVIEDYLRMFVVKPIRHSVRMKMSGYKEWVGNWCWDSCFISKSSVRGICRFLKTYGYTPESGSERMWNWFETLQPIIRAVQ